LRAPVARNVPAVQDFKAKLARMGGWVTPIWNRGSRSLSESCNENIYMF
jgi:hypothetical protein